MFVDDDGSAYLYFGGRLGRPACSATRAATMCSMPPGWALRGALRPRRGRPRREGWQADGRHGGVRERGAEVVILARRRESRSPPTTTTAVLRGRLAAQEGRRILLQLLDRRHPLSLLRHEHTQPHHRSIHVRRPHTRARAGWTTHHSIARGSGPVVARSTTTARSARVSGPSAECQGQGDLLRQGWQDCTRRSPGVISLRCHHSPV